MEMAPYIAVICMFVVAQICRGYTTLQYWTGVKTRVETIQYFGWTMITVITWVLILYSYEPTFTYLAVLICLVSSFTSIPLRIFQQIHADTYLTYSKILYAKHILVNMGIALAISLVIDIATHRVVSYMIFFTPAIIFSYLAGMILILKHTKIRYVHKHTLYTLVSIYHFLVGVGYYTAIHYQGPFVILRG